MGSIPNNFPVSLRTWPSSTSSNGNELSKIIERINIERGGFQNITEESLRQEIAEAELDNGSENDSSDVESEEEPDRLKQLMTAREDIIGQIEMARYSAQSALDFVSLLLSKDMPVQAGLSISPQLREWVPTGTLGADKVKESLTTDAQKKDNKQIAKGWKLQSLDKTVDSILASATRLEKEIELETKYWEQVRAVSDKGWAICRLPNEKHILGVRFGFSEASPAFRNRSLAALRRNTDGSISLDQGIAESEPRCLRVRVQVGGTETGSSPLPQPAAEDAPIETLILQARNTIFSEELWHELNREARTLGAFGVRPKDDTLIWPVSDTRNIILDLVPLSDSNQNTSASGPDNALAEAIFLSLNLLLSYAHRQNHHRRTQPPLPISSEKRRPLPYGLLRPLLNRLQHQEALLQMRGLFRTLCQVLKSASVTPEPSYTMTQTIFPNNSVPIPEYTLSSLTDHPEVVATWILSDDTSITIKAQTIIIANQTTYTLILSPSSPLHNICPAPNPPQLSSFDALREYILYATSCFLASTFSEPQIEDEDAEGWVQTIQQNILRKHFAKEKKSRQMSISLLPVTAKAKDGIRLKVMWEWMKGDTSGFRLKTGDEIGGEGKGIGSHQWVAWEGGDESEMVVMERSLREVVESAGK